MIHPYNYQFKKISTPTDVTWQEQWLRETLVPMSNRLEAVGISLDLGQSRILEEVHFCLEQGGAVVLLGPSGAGKSSLLRVLAGLLEPTRGSVRLHHQQGLYEGRDVRSQSAWMAQQDLLLPWASILKNALPPMNRSRAELVVLRQEALALLDDLGLAGWEKRLPHELSQGMRQRVALARTLMMKRPFLLLDEPCSALDGKARQRVLELLAARCHPQGCGIVMVSHHADDAEVLGAQGWELRRGRLCPA